VYDVGNHVRDTDSVIVIRIYLDNRITVNQTVTSGTLYRFTNAHICTTDRNLFTAHLNQTSQILNTANLTNQNYGSPFRLTLRTGKEVDKLPVTDIKFNLITSLVARLRAG